MKSIQIQLLILLSLLITSSLIFTQVAAQDDDPEETEETEETDQNEREISIDRSDTRVGIESSSETEGQEDSLEVEIEISSYPTFELEYYTENETTETEAEIGLELVNLVEFEDNNDNGVFDGETNDDLLQTYDLDEAGFKPMNYTTSELQSGTTQHLISFETLDGIFKVNIYIVGDFANIDGNEIAPTSLKIDYIFTGFNFTSETSKLALFSEVYSSTEIEIEEESDSNTNLDDDEEGVVQNTEGTFAFYTWLTTATVDGQTTDVLASYNEDSGDYKEIYLNYEQGQEIIHDPELGVSLSSAPSERNANNPLPFTPILLIILALSIPLLVRNYKRI